jgi:hypothetical protein
VIFPSHHGGFLGGEYGQAGEPDAFAAKLRQGPQRSGGLKQIERAKHSIGSRK